jgi:hypothetical protein
LEGRLEAHPDDCFNTFLHKDDDYQLQLDETMPTTSSPERTPRRHTTGDIIEEVVTPSTPLKETPWIVPEEPRSSPSRRRRRRRRQRSLCLTSDTDSDVEDLKHVLSESTEQLRVTNSILREEREIERCSSPKVNQGKTSIRQNAH